MPRTPYGFCVLQNAPQFWMHFEEISTALFIEATAGYMPKITNYEMFLNFNNVHRICLIYLSTPLIHHRRVSQKGINVDTYLLNSLNISISKPIQDVRFWIHLSSITQDSSIKWFQAILMRLNCTTFALGFE